MELRNIQIIRERVTEQDFFSTGSTRPSAVEIRTEYILEVGLWSDIRNETIVHRWQMGNIPDESSATFSVIMKEILQDGHIRCSNNLRAHPIYVGYADGHYMIAQFNPESGVPIGTLLIDGTILFTRSADAELSTPVPPKLPRGFGTLAEGAVRSSNRLAASLQKLSETARVYGKELAYEINYSEQQPGWWLEIAEPIRKAISEEAKNSIRGDSYEEDSVDSVIINVEDYECRDVTVYYLSRMEINKDIHRNTNIICITIDYCIPQNRAEILTAFRRTRAKVGGRLIRLKPSKK
jgi:hypothetical protein